MLTGIDIHARYQKGIQPTTMPNVNFVITKTTGGKDFVVSGWQNMIQGIDLVGVYHYAQEKGDAGTPQEEALNFISQAKLAPKNAILVLDWEEGTSPSLGDPNWVLEWMSIVEKELGRKPLFYTYHATLLKYPALAKVYEAGYKLWYARYPYSTPQGWVSWKAPTNVPYWTSPTMWQYSSAGGVPGWSGGLDLNIFYGTKDDWLSLGQSTTTGTVKEKLTPTFTLPAAYKQSFTHNGETYIVNNLSGTYYKTTADTTGIPSLGNVENPTYLGIGVQ